MAIHAFVSNEYRVMNMYWIAIKYIIGQLLIPILKDNNSCEKDQCTHYVIVVYGQSGPFVPWE